MLRRLEFLTAGESHGKGLSIILLGVPAGLRVDISRINEDLKRRQGGYGRGGRMRIESDRVEIISGVRNGVTIGSPIAMLIENRDWQNWLGVMEADPESFSEDLANQKRVTFPRPGHADLAGGIKYDQTDLRNVLERASARETAARVAVGGIAKRLLEEFGIVVRSHVTRIGPIAVDPENLDFERVESSPLRCADAAAESEMIAFIDRCRSEGDSVGGCFEVRVSGVPVGLGSHTHWDQRLDAMLAGAVMSIPAIKGVEIGLGFEAATKPGSQVHDEIGYEEERGFFRYSNRAGGIEGGISNGEEIVIRAAMKPIPTLMKPLRSVDVVGKVPVDACRERSDVCAVPAAGVVGEAMCAVVLADAMMVKFGGDTVEEMKDNYHSYRRRVEKWPT